MPCPPANLSAITGPLLAWYQVNRRALPFRQNPTPYQVWLSEVMLQQTQVATVLPYYTRFLARLPGIAALAACEEEELHKLWQGLGYYSRARNMHRAAQLVMQRHGGELPANHQALLALPGIGPYTAGAIASIAFGLPTPAVDGNVLRVTARLLAMREDITLPAAKAALTAAVATALPEEKPGDFNQALMELGALVCTPKNPSCAGCPLARLCRARAAGLTTQLPVKRRPAPRQIEALTLLIIQSQASPPGPPAAVASLPPLSNLEVLRGAAGSGCFASQSQPSAIAPHVFLHKRPPTGLLAGLWSPPLLPGHLSPQQVQAQLSALLPGATVLRALPPAKHAFTHRTWLMQAYLCAAPPAATPLESQGLFVSPAQLQQAFALPAAFKAYLPWLCPEE